MNALVDDALSYVRGVDLGVVRSRLDLADLVASDIAEREAIVPGLPIETIFTDGPVTGDSLALRRVVANLIDNAQRFGRSKVRATLSRDGAHVYLTIVDDGLGIPQDQWSAVLMPFHRVENSRSRETGGNGLGLTIASRIVEAHGGHLSIARSALGGAEVRVALPTV